MLRSLAAVLACRLDRVPPGRFPEFRGQHPVIITGALAPAWDAEALVAALGDLELKVEEPVVREHSSRMYATAAALLAKPNDWVILDFRSLWYHAFPFLVCLFVTNRRSVYLLYTRTKI